MTTICFVSHYIITCRFCMDTSGSLLIEPTHPSVTASMDGGVVLWWRCGTMVAVWYCGGGGGGGGGCGGGVRPWV